jgi:hypothetical protein
MHRNAPTRRGRPRGSRVTGTSVITPQQQEPESPVRELQNAA